MKYTTKTGTLADMRADCAVTSLKAGAKVARQIGSKDVFAAATGDFDNSAGQVLMVPLGSGAPIRRLLVVGGLDGSADEKTTEADFRKAVKAAAERLAALRGSGRAGTQNVIWALTDSRVAGVDVHWKASTGLAALSGALYVFNEHKSKDSAKPLPVRSVAMLADERSRSTVSRAVREAQALKSGLDWARDLGNQPPNVCNPNYLLKEARRLGRNPEVTVTSLDEKKMTELGMGAFMAVSQGSASPGRMIIIRYNGAKKRTDPPIALVGKGITFDTGGISLKPPATMDEMKFDMCGAASVLGATLAAIEAKLPINLVTVVAAAENMPSGRATRPGDIVETLSGRTVEILNTDAEGRLVLCDALTYVERYKPRVTIDVATLTGAAIVALGSHASAMYANEDGLADALLEAGEQSGDRAWRMPLWDEYQSSLKSPFADVANIGNGGAGSVTAACFLARFTENHTWAHLDVAGSAFQGGAKKGATGRPVGLLFRYLLDQAGR